MDIISAPIRKTAKERRIEELLSKLKPGDTLIIPELSRLVRSTLPCLSLNNQFSANVESRVSGENNKLIDKG